jgi:DNA end-binding protein Ku
MRKLAEHILDTKAADFDPSRFDDQYETAVVEMLKRKQAGMTIRTEAPEPAPRNVINLMDALKRSIEAERKPTAQTPREHLRGTLTKSKPARATTAATTARSRVARSERGKRA